MRVSLKEKLPITCWQFFFQGQYYCFVKYFSAFNRCLNHIAQQRNLCLDECRTDCNAGNVITHPVLLIARDRPIHYLSALCHLYRVFYQNHELSHLSSIHLVHLQLSGPLLISSKLYLIQAQATDLDHKVEPLFSAISTLF